MYYVSTRGGEEKKSAAEAIKQGIAENGGLFMPSSLPRITQEDLEKLAQMTYPQRAAHILSLFLTDYQYDELLADCEKAYAEDKFPGGPAPITDYSDKIKMLELWHGPTCAFKDMALQIMPRMLARALEKTNEKRTALILVATSGDTGKAALEGYKDVPGVQIQVFYPVDGVSNMQKRQMAVQEGENVCVCAIKGNFDDAQNGVKKIFGDTAFNQQLEQNGYFLSSANSINWGRLCPQIVYYVSAYCDMVARGDLAMGEKLDVCVPTGNFGNIFAAFIAKQMGLPIGKLICASNRNNILTDFLRTGVYDKNRPFYATMSPSMDILISSNLERLLYFLCGAEETAVYMKSLAENGKYEISKEIMAALSSHFIGAFCSEEETAATIKTAFEHGYLCDTHTAVALKCALAYEKESTDKTAGKLLVVSTASPYKFAPSVLKALDQSIPENEFDSIDALIGATGTKAPKPLLCLKDKKIRFDQTIEADAMKNAVLSFTQSN
ncbi:MAG: threonine synthase [Clostridiales bacterium]|nr:threonine synthase [Clostridiales bacterium]